jgi:hypothetical protein
MMMHDWCNNWATHRHKINYPITTIAYTIINSLQLIIPSPPGYYLQELATSKKRKTSYA